MGGKTLFSERQLRFVFSIDLLEIAFGIALAIANRPPLKRKPL